MRRLTTALVLALLLCALAPVASASVANTAIDADAINVVSNATINSTENTLTVSDGSGNTRRLQLVSNDTDWIYRSSSGGTDLKVAKGQTLTLTITRATTIYFVRQSADGTLQTLPLIK